MPRAFMQHPDLLPDIIAFFENYLPAYHIAEDLTGWKKDDKWITIQPTGGQIFRIRGGTAQMDVNVYGPLKHEAFNIAMEAVKTFMQMLNYAGEDAVITNVECSYPADISDPLNSNPRYVFDVNLSYRTKS